MRAPTGVTTTAAVADWLESAALVAVTVAFVLAFTAGAVKRPVLSMVPADADQVTDGLVLFATVALNCTVPDETTVEVVGLMETEAEMFDPCFPELTPAQAREKIVRQTTAQTSRTSTLFRTELHLGQAPVRKKWFAAIERSPAFALQRNAPSL